MAFIKTFVPMIVELSLKGRRRFSADGMEQVGDPLKFGGFLEVDAFKSGVFGEQIKEYE